MCVCVWGFGGVEGAEEWTKCVCGGWRAELIFKKVDALVCALMSIDRETNKYHLMSRVTFD